MPTLLDTDILRRAENKVSAELDEETVILDIEGGHYFQLNRTGARIWELLDAPISVSELCEKLAAAFNVDPETCRADVVDFFTEIEARGLAVRTAG